MILRILFTLLFSCVFFLSQASAAGNCYSNQEFEAEQGLRIHSELMVIGLTCQKVRGGEGLYNKYRKFTNKNQYLIGQYEDVIMGHFRSYGQDAEASLHDLRTGLANEISQKAIRMNMVAFCKHYGGRIDQALNMDHNTLRRWAQQQWPTQPPSKPLCNRSY